MGHRDQVSPETAKAVFERDKGCVAPLVDPATTVCRSQYGVPHHRSYRGMLTLDHVKSEPRMGVRAPSDMGHLVSLCYGHHIATTGGGSNWATAHRSELRDYLAGFEETP
jgi:hypothetical protein